MLRKLRARLNYANVVATMALFVALGGTAYAVNTIGSSDIIDGEVKSVDIGNGEVGSADVKDNSINTFDVHSFLGVDVVDGSLTAKDVGENEFNFPTNVPSIGPNECWDTPITGISAQGDHLLLTPELNNANGFLIHSVQYSKDSSQARLQVCNPRDDLGSIAQTTNFNLLVLQR